MKTLKTYAPLWATILLIVGIWFIPILWLKIVLYTFIAVVWLTQIAIYLLRHQPERLKKWFPKHKWHIQRLHEQYINK